jgi:hypothetical protein
MRAIRWSTGAVITALAAFGLAVSGCGKDNGPDDNNVAPTANFTFDCSDLDCDFSDLSSDPDGTVSSVNWDFGDDATAGIRNPSHSYAAGGTYTVTMTVTDNDGAEGTLSRDVVATDPGTQPTNNAPSADFDLVCISLTCTFTDSSTDPDGNDDIVAWEWEFGDGAVSDVQNPPAHTYSATALASFTVRLRVTDAGGLSSSRSLQISVAPPATLTCDGSACTLLLPEPATVQVTLESRECTARNNTFKITQPAEEVLFTDGCYSPDLGTTFDLNGGEAYAAGTELEAEVLSGSVKLETEPALQVTGSFQDGWTLEFDDGEDATFPEPDFNDLVIRIVATPAP